MEAKALLSVVGEKERFLCGACQCMAVWAALPTKVAYGWSRLKNALAEVPAVGAFPSLSSAGAIWTTGLTVAHN